MYVCIRLKGCGIGNEQERPPEGYGCALSVHICLSVRERKYNKKLCVCVCVCVCLNIKFVCTRDDYTKSYVYLLLSVCKIYKEMYYKELGLP